MIRHADDGFLADLEMCGCDRNALVDQTLHFADEMFQVNDHAVAHHVDGVRTQNARRQQVENELALVVDNGVPRIVAALIADDDVVVLGKQVNHSALAFVTPVDAYDRRKLRCLICH